VKILFYIANGEWVQSNRICYLYRPSDGADVRILYILSHFMSHQSQYIKFVATKFGYKRMMFSYASINRKIISILHIGNTYMWGPRLIS